MEAIASPETWALKMYSMRHAVIDDASDRMPHIQIS